MSYDNRVWLGISAQMGCWIMLALGQSMLAIAFLILFFGAYPWGPRQ